MKNVKYIRQVFAFLLIISILIISGCKEKSQTPADSNKPTKGGTTTTSTTTNTPTQRRQLDDMLKLADPNEVAATVNGVEIKEGEIEEVIQPRIDALRNDLKNTPALMQIEPAQLEAMIGQEIANMRNQTLLQLIREELLEEQVKDVNIPVTNEEAENTLEEQLATQGVDMTNFKTVLKERGIDYQEIIDGIKKDLVHIKYIESKMGDSVNTTEEEAKKYYDDNPTQFFEPERVKASHILIMAGQEEPNDVKQKAKEKIEDILARIKEGADFAELAKENSDDPGSAIDGGDLGYFDRDRMVPEFTEVAFALEPNEVSDVFETDYGYHIMKVTDHKDERTIPFDEIKDRLIELLSNRNKEDFTIKYIESLIKAADIKFPEGKELQIKFSDDE